VEIAGYGDAAVELVNTWGPNEAEGERDDLVDLPSAQQWIKDHLNWDRTLTASDLELLRVVRHRLREVFTADERTAVNIVNQLMNDHPIHPLIAGHDDLDWHIHLAEDERTAGEHVIAMIAFGLAHVLVDGGLERRGSCASHDCDDVYFDTSRNRSRRYCSTTCSTRENVAAFRARQREE
jgi:predicted RNA-binding Zn ribbon-like protein